MDLIKIPGYCAQCSHNDNFARLQAAKNRQKEILVIGARTVSPPGLWVDLASLIAELYSNRKTLPHIEHLRIDNLQTELCGIQLSWLFELCPSLKTLTFYGYQALLPSGLVKVKLEEIYTQASARSIMVAVLDATETDDDSIGTEPDYLSES